MSASFRTGHQPPVASARTLTPHPVAAHSDEVRIGDRTRAPRIGIWGNFGGGNLGNDATLEAALRLLAARRPKARFFCMSYAPDRVRQLFGIDAAPIFAARSHDDTKLGKLALRVEDHRLVWANTRNLDCIVIPGTGILGDFGERPIGLPYAMCLLANVARIKRIPLAFMSVGAGPITHPVSSAFIVNAARSATYRSYRDRSSHALMEKLGGHGADGSVYPDLVFALEAPKQMPRPAGQPRVVGVGVMKYYGHHNDPARGAETYGAYIEKMRSLVATLLERGETVRLLVGENTDARPVADLNERLSSITANGAQERLLTESATTLEQLMQQISTTDVVIASRFHNVIAALKMRRPVVSLSYSHRHDELMRDIGVGEWCQSIETFTPESATAAIDGAYAAAGAFDARIAPRLADYAAALDRQADEVVAALKL